MPYSMISVTTPEPTVLPPSLIANLSPSSIAIGVIRSIVHRDVVSRHAHLCSFRQLQISCYVCRSEVELRSVSVEERRVSSAFFLLQYVYFSLELCVRVDRSRLLHSTCPLSISFLCTPLSSAPMLSPVSALIQQLSEHLYSCYYYLSLLFSKSYDFYFVSVPSALLFLLFPSLLFLFL